MPSTQPRKKAQTSDRYDGQTQTELILEYELFLRCQTSWRSAAAAASVADELGKCWKQTEGKSATTNQSMQRRARESTISHVGATASRAPSTENQLFYSRGKVREIESGWVSAALWWAGDAISPAASSRGSIWVEKWKICAALTCQRSVVKPRDWMKRKSE